MRLKNGIYIEREATCAIILEKYHAFELAYKYLSKDKLVLDLLKSSNPYWGQDIVYFNYKKESFVMLCATGSPCAANAIERAIRTGVKKIITFGTCGSTSEMIKPGTFIVSLAAVRDEGTTTGYLDIRIPAVANLDLTLHLLANLTTLKQRPLIGTTFTTDKRYKENQQELMSLYIKANVLNVDMETASFLIVAQYHQIPLAAFNLVTDCATIESKDSLKGVYCEIDSYANFIEAHLHKAVDAALMTLTE